jgi:hypothetical protein
VTFGNATLTIAKAQFKRCGRRVADTDDLIWQGTNAEPDRDAVDHVEDSMAACNLVGPALAGRAVFPAKSI